jgi:trimeric autotransporter adhesin
VILALEMGGGGGGGIVNEINSELTITKSTIVGNTCNTGGAGIANFGMAMMIVGSTISGNRDSAGAGGGLRNEGCCLT